MHCPFCGDDSQVLDSRTTADGAVRRRRNCNGCKRRFTTYEKLGSPSLKVIKRSGKSEPFDSNKLWKALSRVCRERPSLDKKAITRIARAVESELVDASAKSVRSSRIVDLVLGKLAAVDAVAHARMAADYTDEAGQIRTEARARRTDGDPQAALFPEDA